MPVDVLFWGVTRRPIDQLHRLRKPRLGLHCAFQVCCSSFGGCLVCHFQFGQFAAQTFRLTCVATANPFGLDRYASIVAISAYASTIGQFALQLVANGVGNMCNFCAIIPCVDGICLTIFIPFGVCLIIPLLSSARQTTNAIEKMLLWTIEIGRASCRERVLRLV